MKHDASCLDDDVVKRIARDADADPRSVVRRLAGLPVRGRAGKRIDVAIERHAAPPSTPPHAT